MLEQLFGSRTRWKLLKMFLAQPDNDFYVRQLSRLINERVNSVRRELANLEAWGIIASQSQSAGVLVRPKTREKKYYHCAKNFVLYKELKELIMKSWLLVEKSLVDKISRMGKIKLLILSGRFVNDPEIETDMLVVGTVNRDKLSKFMRELAKSFGEDIHYTIMTSKEYKYRKDVTDRFLYRILESEHIKAIEKS